MADTTYAPKVYRKQGGDEQVIADGGLQTVESGGTVSFASGSILNIGTTPKTTVGIGAKNGTTITAAENGDGILHQTVLTLAAYQQAITDANAYGGGKIYDFPAGRILLLGTTANLTLSVVGDQTTTINATASVTWGLGSATASNATLATTMVDMLPKTTAVLESGTKATTGALAASAQFDGTATAIDCFLNFGFETNTDIDGNGVLQVDGTITLTWVNLGDY